jgi:hypothetical protein
VSGIFPKSCNFHYVERVIPIRKYYNEAVVKRLYCPTCHCILPHNEWLMRERLHGMSFARESYLIFSY